MTTTFPPGHPVADPAQPTPPPPVPPVAPAAPVPPTRGGLHRLVRGRAGDPGWARPALMALLAGSGLLYLWDLAASGWANAFYAAAAQAGSSSWEAFFYGSSDAGNSITVDKPPLSLWVMSLSVRLFGLSSWSLLVPEALMGVATVGVVYLAVRRVAGPGAALVGGAVVALTPVAVLMFRFDNPDALLTLLMALAGYATVRAIEKASLRWLLGVGVLVGLAFMTKTLQAMLVVPGFALAYLVAAPTTVRRRILHLLAAGAALVVSGGWWVAIVELVPASARPYIGGSQTNSVWELIWGYNGLGRLTGSETGSVGGGAPGGAGRWGATGLTRLFGAEVGGQVSWLLPAALLLLVVGLVAVGRAPRTDVRRASLLVWGLWLLVTGLTFSLMAGIFHAYYTVALAPAIGALVGTGGALLWRRRTQFWARLVLAATLAVTVTWSAVLLGRSASFLPWLRPTVLVIGLATALGLLVVDRVGRAVAATLMALAILVGLGGSAAYAVQTAGTPHTGSIPSAGPAVAGANGFGGPGGGPGGRPGGAPGGAPGNGGFGGFRRGGFAGGAPGGFPGGGFPGGGFPGGVTGGATGRVPAGGAGGMGGLLEARQVSAQVAAALGQNASSYTWAAAAVGSNEAAGFQLATQLPVMPIGGFNGSDPSPTLAQFQQYVADGKIHWFIGGGTGMRGQDGGSNAAQQISAWVQQNFTARTVGGVTLYDLSTAAD
jgi:4-amino-4-deoxy-L-arabinose transferase-like glycosyltransferase